MITGFKTGYYYKYIGTQRGLTWVNPMDKVLDHNWRKCEKGCGSSAIFPDVHGATFDWIAMNEYLSWIERPPSIQLEFDF